MTDKNDLPDIDRDRLEGFRKMGHDVVDDLVEAAVSLANRHEHLVDGLRERNAELEHRLAEVQKQLEANVEDAAAPPELALTIDDLRSVLADEDDGRLGGIVHDCMVFDDEGETVGSINVVDTIRELCAELRRAQTTIAEQRAAKAKPRKPRAPRPNPLNTVGGIEVKGPTAEGGEA